MKLSCLLASSWMLAVQAEVLVPARLSFAELMNDGDSSSSSSSLLKVLQEVGMVSITHIPQFPKHQALNAIPGCIQESQATVSEMYADGTVRRSLGTQWTGVDAHDESGHVTMMNHGSDAQDCQVLEDQLATLRTTASTIAKAFAQVLVQSLHLEGTPLLLDHQDPTKTFSLVDIINQGDHIEHFHAYESSSSSTFEESSSARTIEWHVDQGLFLIFTPGMIQNEATDGFWVRLADGSERMVEFDASQDDMVILLGDGVDQYVNAKLLGEKNAARPLRAVPHALTMPSATIEHPRVWYGRMVLPPPSAQHPLYEDLSYGALKEAMAAPQDAGDAALSLGCSSTMRVLAGHEAGNETDDDGCGDGEFPCWHRCMNITEGETATDCENQGLELLCVTQVDEQRFLWDNTHNSIFFPGCANSNSTPVYVTPCPAGQVKNADDECECANGHEIDEDGGCGHDHGDCEEGEIKDASGHCVKDPSSSAFGMNGNGLTMMMVGLASALFMVSA